jgi:hypothetical protein
VIVDSKLLLTEDVAHHQRILPCQRSVDSVLKYSKAANSARILDKPATLRARSRTKASPHRRYLAESTVLSVRL